MGTRKLPKGWEYQELGKLVEINYGTRIVKKNNIPGDYPVYGGGGISFSTQNFNRENKLKIGRFGLSKHNCVQFIEGKFFLNDSGLTLSIKNTDIIEKYLNFFLIGYRDKIYELSRGQGQRNLEILEFKKLKIYFPTSKEEQQKIVDYLDEKFKYIDEMEASRERYVEHLEKLEKAVLRDVFEKYIDYNVLMNDFVETSYGVNAGGKPEGNYNFIRITDINKDCLVDLKSNNAFLNNEYSEIKNYILNKGDILLCRTGVDSGKIGLYNLNLTNSVYAGYLIKLNFKEEDFYNKYVWYFGKSDTYWKQVNNLLSGAAAPHFNAPAFRKIKIPKIDIKTQKIIAYELDKKFELIRDSRERLKRQEENYKNLRKAFLNDVFGGFEE